MGIIPEELVILCYPSHRTGRGPLWDIWPEAKADLLGPSYLPVIDYTTELIRRYRERYTHDS